MQSTNIDIQVLVPIEVLSLVAFVLFLFTALIVRGKVQKLLSEKHEKDYKNRFVEFEVKQIMLCDFKIFKALLNNEKYLMSGNYVADSEVVDYRKKYKLYFSLAVFFMLVFIVMPFVAII